MGPKAKRMKTSLQNERFERPIVTNLNIDKNCISCRKNGSPVVVQHPFFHGGMCHVCKERIMGTCFSIGNDFTHVYCSICGHDGVSVTCSNQNCLRSFCKICILSLGDEKDVWKTVANNDQWMCFICCDSSQPCLVVKPNKRWMSNLSDLFKPPDGKYEPCMVPVPKLLEHCSDKGIRVLSLFDGIATGFLALQEAGIEVAAYFASEIDQTAIAVARKAHGDRIVHIGDVEKIDRAKLKELSPIHMVIGGSPCTELSCVNPRRQGLSKGSGTLFFEYTRILSILRDINGELPLLFLFENVFNMQTDTKQKICSHLECQPIVFDAEAVAPMKRKRLFWGNIPGMIGLNNLQRNKKDKKINLSDFLDEGRIATVEVANTMTTRGNLQNIIQSADGAKIGKLSINEIERAFGFDIDYTKVGNLSKTGRQKLLGRSWNRHVVSRIFLPLTFFFKKLSNKLPLLDPP